MTRRFPNDDTFLHIFYTINYFHSNFHNLYSSSITLLASKFSATTNVNVVNIQKEYSILLKRSNKKIIN